MQNGILCHVELAWPSLPKTQDSKLGVGEYTVEGLHFPLPPTSTSWRMEVPCHMGLAQLSPPQDPS